MINQYWSTTGSAWVLISFGPRTDCCKWQGEQITKNKYFPTVAPGGKIYCPAGCTVVAFYDFPDLFGHLYTDHFYTARGIMRMYGLTPDWCSGFLILSGVS